MKKRKGLPKAVSIAIVVAVLGLVGAGGYFFLVRPQKAKASDLQTQIDAATAQLAQYRAANAALRNAPKIRIADLFRLTKAMPDRADMPGLVLELNGIAEETGISFDSISPHASVTLAGYQVVPIELIFQGNYYDLADFLFRLRNLVDVRSGTLDATGRLFTVDTVDFAEGDARFPQIKATLTVDAFVFGTGAPATTTVPPAVPTGTSGTTTTDTSTTATTPPSTGDATGAAAAGAVP